MTTFCNTVTPSIAPPPVGSFTNPTGVPVGNTWPSIGYGCPTPVTGNIPTGYTPWANPAPNYTNFPVNSFTPFSGVYNNSYGQPVPTSFTPSFPVNTPFTPAFNPTWQNTWNPWNGFPMNTNFNPWNTVPFNTPFNWNWTTPNTPSVYGRGFNSVWPNTTPWNNQFAQFPQFPQFSQIPGTIPFNGVPCSPFWGNDGTTPFNMFNPVNTFNPFTPNTFNPINNINPTFITPWNTNVFPTTPTSPFFTPSTTPWTNTLNPINTNWNAGFNPFAVTTTPFGVIPGINTIPTTPWGWTPSVPFTNLNPFTTINALNGFTPITTTPFAATPWTQGFNPTPNLFGTTLPFVPTSNQFNTPSGTFTGFPLPSTPFVTPFTNTFSPFNSAWNPSITNCVPFNTTFTTFNPFCTTPTNGAFPTPFPVMQNPYGQFPLSGTPMSFIPGMNTPFTSPIHTGINPIHPINPITGVPMNVPGTVGVGGPSPMNPVGVGNPFSHNGARPGDNGDGFPMRNVV